MLQFASWFVFVRNINLNFKELLLLEENWVIYTSL